MKWYFMALLLLLASCTSQPSTEKVSLTGTQGVSVSVVDIPNEVYENEEFPVTFELVNDGVSSVPSDNPGLLIPSYDPLYVDLVDSVSRYPQNYFWLQGKNIYRPGESTFITLYFLANPIQRYSAEVITPIMLTACYPYQSNITTEVCIEQLRRADPGAVVCSNLPVRPPTPGAPIGVDNVEIRNSRIPDIDGGGVAPSFRITIKNYGRGVPASGECDNDQSSKGLNNVSISAKLLSTPLDCGSDEIRLIRGQATVICRLPEDSLATAVRGDSNYQSLLSIYLDYTYRESAKAEVRITR